MVEQAYVSRQWRDRKRVDDTSTDMDDVEMPARSGDAGLGENSKSPYLQHTGL